MRARPPDEHSATTFVHATYFGQASAQVGQAELHGQEQVGHRQTHDCQGGAMIRRPRSVEMPGSSLKRRGHAVWGTWHVENVADPADCSNASRPVHITLDLRTKPTNVHLQIIPDLGPILAPCVVQ